MIYFIIFSLCSTFLHFLYSIDVTTMTLIISLLTCFAGFNFLKALNDKLSLNGIHYQDLQKKYRNVFDQQSALIQDLRIDLFIEEVRVNYLLMSIAYFSKDKKLLNSSKESLKILGLSPKLINNKRKLENFMEKLLNDEFEIIFDQKNKKFILNEKVINNNKEK